MTHEQICGKHSLADIYRREGAASDVVVRWCRKCGAVVIDEDYDGRTNAGAYMTMRFPADTRERNLLIQPTVVLDRVTEKP